MSEPLADQLMDIATRMIGVMDPEAHQLMIIAHKVRGREAQMQMKAAKTPMDRRISR